MFDPNSRLPEGRACSTKIAVLIVLCIAGSLPLAASEMASATYTFSQASPTTWNYEFTLTDTGTTPVGTFWFSWLPGQGYMNTAPLSAAAPTGWVAQTTNGAAAGDGFSERWVDNAGALMPGQSISGLSFISTTTPDQIAGASPFHGGTPELTSDIYMGAPLVGADAPFAATLATTSAPEPSSVVLILVAGVLLLLGNWHRLLYLRSR
jgi:hypothetical protein